MVRRIIKLRKHQKIRVMGNEIENLSENAVYVEVPSLDARTKKGSAEVRVVDYGL